MAGSVTIPNVFQNQTGPLALSPLDANFTALANSVNSVLTFSSYYQDSSGSPNSVIVTISTPQTFAYVAGATLQVKINNTNTTASTINVNALGTKSITTVLGGALIAGQIVAGGIVQLIYDGTNFQLATAGGASFAGGSNTQVQYNNGGVLAGSGLTYNNSTGGFNIAAPSSLPALTVNGVAGASNANFLTTGGDAQVVVQSTTSGDAVLTLTTVGVQTWAWRNLRSSASIALQVAGSNTISVANAGNVTVNAPSSGTALSVNGAASSGAIQAVQGTSGTALSLYDSTLTYYGSFQVGSTAVTANASNSWQFNTSGVARALISSTGNVTVNAPTSGTTLTINNGVGTYAFSTFDGTCQTFLYTNGSGGAVFGTYSNQSISLYSNNTSRVILSAAGNVTVNAPSSGIGLVVNGTSGSVSISAVGQLGGYMLDASGTVANSVWRVLEQTGNTTRLFRITDFSTGSDVDRFTISANGNVTVNAPSSGVALSVNAVGSTNAANFLGGSSNGIISVQSTAASGVACSYESKNSAQTWQIGLGTGVGDNSYYLNDVTRVAQPLKVTTSGNVTINAPASGVSLTVNTGGTNIVVATIGGISVSNGAVFSGSTTELVSTPALNIGTNAAAAVGLWTNSAQRVSVGSAGNVTVNAPTSGTALAITGAANAAGLVVTGSASTPGNSIGNSSTAFTVDCSKSNVHYVTMNGNVAAGSMTISNMQDGQTINLLLTQDATGTRTLGNPTGVKWPGGTVGVLSTAASAVDLIVISQINSVKYATISKAFA
jgi:hypothetical protein